MNSEQRMLCRQLIVTAHGRRQISKEEFVQKFPSALEDGKVAICLLREAISEQSAEDLQCVMVIGASFGFGPTTLEPLSDLLKAKWHFSHEDIVTALDRLGSPLAIDGLFGITQWIPAYLEFDESRALAVKAIWAIGRISGDEATARLQVLASSGEPVLRRCASEQLLRKGDA